MTYFVASSYLEANERFKTLEKLEKGILLTEKIEDKSLLSQLLFAKASFYLSIGNEKKYKEILKQSIENAISVPSFIEEIDSVSITPFEKRNRLRREYARLSTIGSYYQGLDENSKAIDFYKQSLLIAQKLNDRSSEADSLKNIALVYYVLKDWNNSIDFFQQSNIIAREIGYKIREANNLLQIGFIQLELNKPNEALKTITESQIIFSSLGIDESGVANGLAKTWYALGNQRLGIFYERKLINWVLTEREKLNEFDQTTQHQFVTSFEKPIRRLADWLIEDGQFAQAEKVLRLLKEEEFSGFVRRDANEIKNLKGRIDLDDDEKKLIEKYNLLTEEVSKIGQEFYRLEQKQIQLREKGLELNESDAKLLNEKSEQLETARLAFKTFLDKELVKEIGEKRKEGIDEQKSKQETLRDLPKGTVTLYTVLGEDRYRVILTTPDIQVDGKFEIKAAELNKKIFAFRDALQNPKVDPRPLGRELYKILIEPIEKDLENSGAKTLLWYLDGTLRYIPIAALSPDGKSYLVEKYQNVVLTAKSDNLDSPKTIAKWKVLGLGVSDAQKVDNPLIPNEKISFDALPGTKRELTTIISDETVKEKTGILTGRRFLDNEFTVANFQKSLEAKKFNVVHLASHFYLGSKNSNSFLLLGNGQILPLSKFEAGSFIRFGGVDLVTLSACNTAFANTSNGSEVDSLADVIQSRGGKSVLATLWSVADESTSLLMSEFYRIKKENSNMSKSEAMQTAQREMLDGKLKSTAAGNTKGAEIVSTTNGKTDAPPFAADKSKPFAHPYYWSPFVLIGNWK